jgi:predicted lipoprotein
LRRRFGKGRIMSANAAVSSRRASPALKRTIAGIAVLIVLGAMALDTKVVKIGSAADVRSMVFSPAEYGKAEFPKVQADVEARAFDAVTVAAAIAKDRAAAEKEYGVPSGVGPVIPVKFTGVVGEGKSGIYKIAVEGIGDVPLIRVQTGPAINGTELRDATGSITFGQFKNQIEYQNAGSALNNEMKNAVLSKIDTSALTGKTVTVVGAFKLINPKSWLITPVRLDVQ